MIATCTQKNTNTTTQQPHRDESKYEKHARRRREQRLQWAMGVAVSLFLIVFFMLGREPANHEMPTLRSRPRLARLLKTRSQPNKASPKHVNKPRKISKKKLKYDLERIHKNILHNTAGGIRWIEERHLPALPGEPQNPLLLLTNTTQREKEKIDGQDPFYVWRQDEIMSWQEESYDEDEKPAVDYTQHSYKYPPLLKEPPSTGGYPQLSTLGELMERWPQDELDHPPPVLHETLQHFNYSNPTEREMARKFRDAELPFKLYDIPEVTQAGHKWTDEYVSKQFDGDDSNDISVSRGHAQESTDNFFSFYLRNRWHVNVMGLPPVRSNDWTYERWAQHARYADATRLPFDKPHFYWQSGVPKEERLQDEDSWTFVSRDLPSFSSPSETFFSFNPEEQVGIQCRFGERGVTAATHYDIGRNMVALMTGAKRYVLSPPRECSKLGIVTTKFHAIARHSELNFAHLDHLDTEQGQGMPEQERAWLRRAKTSEAVETVLKAGEVLYIPSHWFHYITSLQKSAQCNVQSGQDLVGTREFGGAEEVYQCE